MDGCSCLPEAWGGWVVVGNARVQERMLKALQKCAVPIPSMTERNKRKKDRLNVLPGQERCL